MCVCAGWNDESGGTVFHVRNFMIGMRRFCGLREGKEIKAQSRCVMGSISSAFSLAGAMLFLFSSLAIASPLFLIIPIS